jgi:hypothetical protein
MRTADLLSITQKIPKPLLWVRSPMVPMVLSATYDLLKMAK